VFLSRYFWVLNRGNIALRLTRGSRLQRLFSTFPNGWPGIGLLCLRLAASVYLIHQGILGLSRVPTKEPTALTLDMIGAAAGIILLAGLWTPIAGTVLAIDELLIALSQHLSQQGGSWALTLLAVLGASLAMLGPGAWSVDARLFGRKRFHIGDRTRER